MPGCPIPEFKTNRYVCVPSSTLSGNEKVVKLARTLNVSDYNSNSALYSTVIKPSGRRVACKTMGFENKTLNAFKRWEGAPGGSGARIVNTF